MKWISVKDRLPLKSDKYIVYSNGRVYQTKFYVYPEATGGHWGQKDKGKNITHWMPMPDVPKEKTEKPINLTLSEDEIIKGFECCFTNKMVGHKDCPYYKDYPFCDGDLCNDVLALLNRQKIEIERLNKQREVKNNEQV